MQQIKFKELNSKTKHYEEKMEMFSRMLDNTIFSDDTNEQEKIEQKIAETEFVKTEK